MVLECTVVSDSSDSPEVYQKVFIGKLPGSVSC